MIRLTQNHNTKNIREDFIKKYPQTDDSIFKFVDPDHTFDDLKYTPKNLVKISASKTLFPQKAIEIREDIFPELTKMSENFYAQFGKPLSIVSGFRDYNYQKRIELYNTQCVKDKFCSKAGHSEHQSGLAIDFFEVSSEEAFLANAAYRKYYDWLKENAHHYGFTQSYQK